VSATLDTWEDELVERVAVRVAEKLKPRIVTKEGLAKYLGVGERRVKTLREHGLPARKIGRDLYFDVGEVEQWIAREGRA
jgi:phage terminase Nu1 subunit (DNA packaging protein)